MNKVNWASALVDIVIIIFAFAVAVWQDNPTYLWLVCLVFFSGSYDLKEEEGIRQ